MSGENFARMSPRHRNRDARRSTEQRPRAVRDRGRFRGLHRDVSACAGRSNGRAQGGGAASRFRQSHVVLSWLLSPQSVRALMRGLYLDVRESRPPGTAAGAARRLRPGAPGSRCRRSRCARGTRSSRRSRSGPTARRRRRSLGTPHPGKPVRVPRELGRHRPRPWCLRGSGSGSPRGSSRRRRACVEPDGFCNAPDLIVALTDQRLTLKAAAPPRPGLMPGSARHASAEGHARTLDHAMREGREQEARCEPQRECADTACTGSERPLGQPLRERMQ